MSGGWLERRGRQPYALLQSFTLEGYAPRRSASVRSRTDPAWLSADVSTPSRGGCGGWLRVKAVWDCTATRWAEPLTDNARGKRNNAPRQWLFPPYSQGV